MALKKIKRSEKNPLRSKWPLIFSAIAIPLALSYIFYLKDFDLFSRTTLGRFYGVAALLVIIYLASYRLRKSIYTIRLGPLQTWVQAHVYFGVLLIALLFLHMGYRFSGLFSGLLFVLTLLVVISGIVGTLIYRNIPLSLSKHGKEILTGDETVKRLEAYIEEADKVVSDAPAELMKVYSENIRPRFELNGVGWGYLFREERQLIMDSRALFDIIKESAPAHFDYDFDRLCSIYIEREKLYFKWMKVRALRGWRSLHIPLASATLTAAAVHIISIIYY